MATNWEDEKLVSPFCLEPQVGGTVESATGPDFQLPGRCQLLMFVLIIHRPRGFAQAQNSLCKYQGILYDVKQRLGFCVQLMSRQGV